MNNSQIEKYRRDGYVVLKNVVNPWINIYKSEAYEMCRNAGEKFRPLCRVLGSSAASMDMFLTPALLDFAEDVGIEWPIFQTNPVAHIMGPYLWTDGVGPHQDYAAIQSGLDTVVAWIPFFDVGLEDYPVEVVPGSHLLGLLPSKTSEHINEIDTTGMEFVPITMKRGDVLLFSVFTVHRTRTPGTGFRAAISHRYENAEDKWFVEHDFYSAQRRIIDREIKFAPTVEQVRAVFEE